MAVLGEAWVVIRPITAGFESSVARSMKKLESSAAASGARAGKQYGGAFGRAFGPDGAGKYTNEQLKKAVSVQKAYANLTRAGYLLQTGLGALGGSIGALVGGLVALGGALLSAAPSAVALGGALVYVGVGAAVAKLALGGVGKAVAALNKQQNKAAADTTAADRRVEDANRNLTRVIADGKKALKNASENVTDAEKEQTKAQLALNKAMEEGNEQLQQLNFDAEDAALAETRAANELEDARKTLARVQDLPPNSRARREAELAYKEADLNLRRAKDRNSDLAKEQERLSKTGAKGLDSVISATEAYADATKRVDEAKQAEKDTIIDVAQREDDARRERDRALEDQKKKQDGSGPDPLAGLTESQKKFALYLASLKPLVDDLKETAAAAFLPKLQEAIDQIATKGFSTIKTGVGEVGSALGDASLSLSNAITESGNLKDLGTLFTNAAEAIRKIGEIAGNLWGVFLGVMKAADPLIQKFLGWLETVTGKWDAWLNKDENVKKLTDFFNEAGRVAGEIGTIIGNIAGGLGNIIKANTGPGTGGQIMLDYFKEITGAFKEFSGSGSGQQKLKDYFAGAAENTKAIFGSIGGFVKELLKLGDDPNVKKFWDKIGEAAPAFGKIMQAGLDAAPSMANLFVTIADIMAALSDSGGPRMFFDTLNLIAGVVKAIVENPMVQWLLNISGRIHGVVLALGLVATAITAAKWLMLGMRIATFNTLATFIGFNNAAKVWGIMQAGISKVTGLFKLLNLSMLANPIFLIAAAVIGLIALFVVLYNKNETFRKFVDEVWGKIKEAIKAVVDWIMEVGTKIWDGIKVGLEVAWAVIKFIWDALVAYVKAYITVITTVISVVWNVLKTGLEIVWAGIKIVWDLIVAGIKIYIGVITTVIKFVWDVLTTALKVVWEAIKIVWDTIVKGVSGFIKLITTALSVIWDFISKGLSTAWGVAKGVWDTIVTFVGGIGAKITSAAKGMWDGMKSGLQGVINFIIGAINWIIRALNKVKFTFPGWVPGVGGKTFGIDIKELAPVQLAAGGIIKPSRGGTLAQIAEAGRPERVEPLDPDGLSKRDKAMIQMLTNGGTAGATFNIYPSPGMDEVELAALVSRQIAFQTRRGAA